MRGGTDEYAYDFIIFRNQKNTGLNKMINMMYISKGEYVNEDTTVTSGINLDTDEGRSNLFNTDTSKVEYSIFAIPTNASIKPKNLVGGENFFGNNQVYAVFKSMCDTTRNPQIIQVTSKDQFFDLINKKNNSNSTPPPIDLRVFPV